MKPTRARLAPSVRASAALLSALTLLTSAQAGLWDGNAGVGDLNWSTDANWNPDASQLNQAVLFDDTFGETANATTVGNIVNSNLTIDSLGYANTGTSGNSWQVTEISTGVTLTIDAATAPAASLSVGGVTGSTSRTAIRGAGTLTVNEPAGVISVGTPSANQSATLDMSGLATFNATVASLNFGASRGNGDVTLAATNTLVATTFNIGNATSSTGNNTKSDLLLGTTNTIHANTINVGISLASGTIGFRTGLTAPTVTIRGAAGGDTRADLNIASNPSSSMGNTQGSSVDFTASGGSVDAKLGAVLIGRRGDAGGSTTYVGSLTMNQGSIDATSVALGQSSGTGALANSVTGNLTVAGGTFTTGSLALAANTAGATSVDATVTVSGTGALNITGDIVAGSKAGTATSVTATIAVSGGSLTIGGNLAEGAGAAGVTSAVTLGGGTLDLTHGNISVDTFTFTGGTLKDVGAFTGNLDVQNSSTLAFGLDGSFTSLALTGSLALGASANLQLTLANGFAPASDFLLVDNDGSDSVSASFATINGSAFGPGNTFTLTNDLGSYDFVLTYGGGTGNDLVALFTPVPEPSSYAALAASFSLLLAATRRRRRAA